MSYNLGDEKQIDGNSSQLNEQDGLTPEMDKKYKELALKLKSAGISLEREIQSQLAAERGKRQRAEARLEMMMANWDAITEHLGFDPDPDPQEVVDAIVAECKDRKRAEVALSKIVDCVERFRKTEHGFHERQYEAVCGLETQVANIARLVREQV